MAQEFENIDIWAGSFPSEERLDRYFEETHPEDDDESPISEFAADMGQWFYDHDLFERGFLLEKTNDFRVLVGPHSFSSSYFESANAAFQRLNPVMVNTFVMGGRGGTFVGIDNPKSVIRDDYQLHYLGKFKCDPDSAPLICE